MYRAIIVASAFVAVFIKMPQLYVLGITVIFFGAMYLEDRRVDRLDTVKVTKIPSGLEVEKSTVLEGDEIEKYVAREQGDVKYFASRSRSIFGNKYKAILVPDNKILNAKEVFEKLELLYAENEAHKENL